MISICSLENQKNIRRDATQLNVSFLFFSVDIKLLSAHRQLSLASQQLFRLHLCAALAATDADAADTQIHKIIFMNVIIDSLIDSQVPCRQSWVLYNMRRARTYAIKHKCMPLTFQKQILCVRIATAHDSNGGKRTGAGTLTMRYDVLFVCVCLDLCVPKTDFDCVFHYKQTMPRGRGKSTKRVQHSIEHDST